jgi:hypothetical protein
MFTLSISTSNSAFDDFSGHEVARILRALAKRVESGEEVDGAIFDLNGNKCGSWCLEAEEE